MKYALHHNPKSLTLETPLQQPLLRPPEIGSTQNIRFWRFSRRRQQRTRGSTHILFLFVDTLPPHKSQNVCNWAGMGVFPDFSSGSRRNHFPGWFMGRRRRASPQKKRSLSVMKFFKYLVKKCQKKAAICWVSVINLLVIKRWLPS